MNDKKDLFHFKVQERMQSGSKSVNFTVKEEKHDVSKKEKDAFIKFVEKKLRQYNDAREERYEIQFPDKEYKGAFSDQWGRVNRKDLINFLTKEFKNGSN